MSSLAAALVGVFMIVMGIAMAATWTIDIVRSPEVDRARGLVRARDRSTGSLLVPHWLAEYGTAALLLAGGARLVLGLDAGSWWAWLVAAGLGCLAYSSLDATGLGSFATILGRQGVDGRTVDRSDRTGLRLQVGRATN